MRMQSIHRQALVIITFLSFLWIFQRVLEAWGSAEEPLDDINIKAKIEERHDLEHEDEIFVKGSDVQVEEDEMIDNPEEERSDSNEDNIDQDEKEKLVQDRAEDTAHDLDKLMADIENKIDGPTSNMSKGGLDDSLLSKKSKPNSKLLKVVDPDVDQNQEAGRKKVDAPAKSKTDLDEGSANRKKGPNNHRADKKLQVMKSDGSRDIEAGRRKIAEDIID